MSMSPAAGWHADACRRGASHRWWSPEDGRVAPGSPVHHGRRLTTAPYLSRRKLHGTSPTRASPLLLCTRVLLVMLACLRDGVNRWHHTHRSHFGSAAPSAYRALVVAAGIAQKPAPASKP